MGQWPAGVGRQTFRSIDSTNAEARRAIGAGTAPAWILAHEQTAGVGRRGRAWSTLPGNFAATYLMAMPSPMTQAALYSFVASLALRDALIDLGVTGERLTLKWPNDVLLDDGKLAGILLETAGIGPSHLCVGIGVNLATAPENAKVAGANTPPRTLRADAALTVDAETLLDTLAPCFAYRAEQFETHGFAATRVDWLAHAARLGQRITARLPKSEISGIYQTVDEAGAVILNTETGLQAVTAADIFFE